VIACLSSSLTGAVSLGDVGWVMRVLIWVPAAKAECGHQRNAAMRSWRARRGLTIGDRPNHAMRKQSGVTACPFILSATRTNEGILLLRISKFGAALMMGVGPPRSVCRHGSQTTQCCCGSKDHGGEQLGKRRCQRGRQVSVEKVNESEPDRRRIVKRRSVVETAEVRSLRDQPGRYLLTAQAATGVKAARARHGHRCGTREI
jgi:hypothetical protein